MGALVYSVLRCRDTGEKMVFAAARLPSDDSAGGRMRTLTSFLKNTASYPVICAGTGLSLGAKNDTAEANLFSAGYASGRALAAEKTGEDDPGAAVFFPCMRTAVQRYEGIAPGLVYTEFQKAG